MKLKLLLTLISLFFVSASFAQTPPWYWAKQGATSGSESAMDVCADPLSSGVYVGGVFNGNLNSVYGSSLSASAGQDDSFVLKYDGAGNVIWAFNFGGTGNDYIASIAADPSGDIYVAGNFNGTCDFDPSPFAAYTLSSAGQDGFLAKYNSAGTFQWALKYGGSGADDVWSVYADANGVYLTGSFTGIASFSTTIGVAAILSSSGAEDIFGAMYNSSGVRQWVVRQGDSQKDIGYEVVSDNNAVYFIGTYDQNINLYNAIGVNPAASHTSEVNNKTSVVISAYTKASGTLVWSNNISSTDNLIGAGICQDNTNIYITGAIANTANFKYPQPTFSQTASGNRDFFLAALSKTTGVFQWVSSQTGSSSGSEMGSDVEVVNNRIIVSGQFTGAMNYAPWGGPVFNSVGADPFLTAFDLSGNYVWTSVYGGNNAEPALGLDVNATGAVFVCGSYMNGINFGNISLATAGNDNIFVAKMGCDSILSNVISPATQTICTGSSPSVISGTISAGYNYSVQWETSSNGTNWISAGATATNNAFTPAALSNTTWFRRVVTALSGCSNFSASPSVVVSVDQMPYANAGTNQTVCVSSPVATLNAILPSFGSGQWSVLSGSASITSSLQPMAVAGNLALGTNVLQWQVSNGQCPPVSSTVSVVVDNLTVPIYAGRDQTICAQSTTLNAMAPSVGTASWVGTGSVSFQNPLLAGTTVSGLSTGTNILVWQVSVGVCPPANDTVLILSDALPSVPVAGSDQTVCSASAQLNASAPQVGFGVWSLISGTAAVAIPSSNTGAVSGLGVGDNVFRWTVSNGTCPSAFDEVKIYRELPPDTAYAGPDQYVDQPVAQLSANTPVSGTGRWQLVSGNGWIDNATSPSAQITGLSEGDNKLRWTISKGSCTPNSSDLVIRLAPLKVPDGFSPNGDGFNDQFVVPGINYYTNIRFSVFNRWGGLVYENTNYSNDWDGKSRSGELLSDDTYYFVMEILPGMSYNGFIVLKTSR